MKKFLIFMAIWIAGSAFHEHVIGDIPDAYLMVWGFAVGTIASVASGMWKQS